MTPPVPRAKAVQKILIQNGGPPGCGAEGIFLLPKN